ncbi:MAG: alpha/beta hydrolase [Lentisphaeria bacterium]|nr:alpha/beta hydrolase [Lentisphaeria bacterium]
MKKIEIWSDKSKSTTLNDGHEEPTFLGEFLLDKPDTAAATILILPGGGYDHFGMHEGEAVAKKFNELNFNTYVLYYRHYPQWTYPAPLEDALRAMKIIRNNAAIYGYDPNKIAALGFSAGGHLANCCAFNPEKIDAVNGDEIDKISPKVNALVLCYSVINICDSKRSHIGSGNALFGTKEITEQRKRFNFEHVTLDDDTPPVFFWHTATDTGVPIYYANLMAQHLWANKKTAELHIFSHCNHGIGLAETYEDIRIWPELAANFLKQNL